MRYSNDLKPEIKEPLGGSSLEDWASFLENSHGGTMRPLFRASLLERICAYSRTPRGLAVISILWALFLIALVFVFTPRTSWEIPVKAFTASSTAASLLGKNLGGWTARRLYCTPSQPCAASNPFSEEGPFNLRLEMHPEEVKYVA